MAEILESPSAAGSARRSFCADVSRAHAEPLAATASRVDNWILVEYRDLWTRDALAGSGLRERVKDHLRTHVRALPNARLLFVRRPERRGQDRFAVYVARSLESDQALFGLELDGYDQLLDLDLAGASRGDAVVGDRLHHPLLVVCTHGKRDPCCAKYGRPLYDELRAEVEPEWVWQSTHVGGDRFAGNLVVLPAGLYFGRVERADLWPLLDDYLAGRIRLDRYRGRSCYPFAVQAGERTVREETGLVGVDDLRLVATEPAGERGWTMRFVETATGVRHDVDVAAEVAADPTYLTCSAPAPQRPRRYVASAHRVSPAE